jgi:cytoskeletal protein CcmA (bactofilin family)
MSRFAALLIVILTVPSVALAASVMRTGEGVSVAADQAVEGDFYGLGNNVTMSGEVTEDLLIIGGKVKVNGKTGSDLAVLAGDVQIDGLIGDDARIVAGEVTVAGEVLGDLVVLAGSLKVLSTAKISGDILFFGTDAVISGEVGKSIFGTSERIRIEGVVRGDIEVKTGSLTLGERADVTGMVKYTSANEIVRAQNARVAGQVIQNKPALEEATFRDVLVPLLILLFAALVWYLLFGRLLQRVSTQVVVHPVRSMLIGFGLFFLIPIAVSILVASMLGLLLGLTLVFAYIALLFAAVTISGIVAGTYLFTLMTPKHATGIPSVLFGTSVFFLLLYIPIIGPVLCIALVLTTMGALATHLYRTIRFS